MYKYWFANIKGINTKEKATLITRAGSERELHRMPERQLDKIWGISEKTMEKMKESRKTWNLESEYERFLKTGITLVIWTEHTYPERLREIYNPPWGLYVKGALPDPEKKAVAIVGARMCSEYGRAVAEKTGKTLAEHNIEIISGLALGIDSAAQWGALRGKGKTYAIMGCGADICYPQRNVRLYHEIMEHGGIISENPIKMEPKPWLFPQRNRIISGLSDAVIIAEAREKSGSLITADFALEQGKNVYGVPGRINDTLNQGTNRLISQGAGIFLSVEEVLKDMGISIHDKYKININMDLPLEKNEMLVYSVLDLTPRNLEWLITKTELSFQEVTGVLFQLQKRGYVKETYKNYYIKNIDM